MKIIKKNQLTILVIALMLVTAGYLNYTSYNGETVETVSDNIIIESENLAGIGDARLVNSDVIENIENLIENNNIDINSLKNEVMNVDSNVLNNVINSVINETVTTNADTSTDEYFVKSRLDREKMYSQMIESYQKILESSSISNEQKEISQNKINNINKTKNAIMISENLIKNKGFEECILFINDMSINVVVKKSELSTEDIAQIQNIISRELGAEIENIHITNR